MKTLLPLALALFIVRPLFATDFSPPPEAIPLEDERMADYFVNPAHSAIVTGSIKNLPAEAKSKLAITCYVGVLDERAQIPINVPLAADGSFRVEFAEGFPVREMFFRFDPFVSVAVLLTKDLHIELGFGRGRRTPQVAFSGADGELNRIAAGFDSYERKRQDELWRPLRGTRNVPAADAAAALAKVVENKRALDQMLQAYAPARYGWILQQRIDEVYHNAVLSCTFGHKALKDSPVVAETMAYRPYLYSRDAVNFYVFLMRNILFDGATVLLLPSFSDELPEYEKRALAAGPEAVALLHEYALLLKERKSTDKTGSDRLKELRNQLEVARVLELRSDGAAQMHGLKLKQLPGKLPDAKLNLVLLTGVNAAPTEALAAYALFEPRFGQRWPWQYLDSARRKAMQEQVSVTVALARASQTTEGALGDAGVKLESGARLYQRPDLSGEAVIAAIKTTYPGKALLLDFWGPWCAPCMDDMPSSKTLHEAVADAPIEFVYLCSQSDEVKWKEAIVRLGLSGTHVLLTDKQNSELGALFQVSGYPTYAWIDRQGTFHPGTIERMRTTTPAQLRQLVTSDLPPLPPPAKP